MRRHFESGALMSVSWHSRTGCHLLPVNTVCGTPIASIAVPRRGCDPLAADMHVRCCKGPPRPSSLQHPPLLT